MSNTAKKIVAIVLLLLMAGCYSNDATSDSTQAETADLDDVLNASEFALTCLPGIDGKPTPESPEDGSVQRIQGKIEAIVPERFSKKLALWEYTVWLECDAWNFLKETQARIRCEFDDATKLMELKEGQHVVIEGTYDKFLNKLGLLGLTKCQILSSKPASKDALPAPPVLMYGDLMSAADRLDRLGADLKYGVKIEDYSSPNKLNLRLHSSEFHAAAKKFGSFPSGLLSDVSSLPIDSIDCFGISSQQLLAAIDRFDRLRRLTIRGELNCSPEDLLNLEKLDHLRVIEISSADLNDEYLMSLAKLTNLRQIKLSGSFVKGNYQITDAGIEALTKLPHLQVLSFGDTENITDECFATIAKMPHLRKLTVYHSDDFNSPSSISDAALEYLTSDSVPDLKVLMLAGQANVTDKGVETLIKNKRQFTVVSFSRTGVTDQGVRRIIEKGLTKQMNYLPPGISDDVKQKLIDAKIYWEK